MTTTSPSPASSDDRPTAIANWFLIFGFFASYFVARVFVRDESLPALVRFVLCFFPAIMGGVVIHRIVAFVRSLVDELERRIQSEAFAFAFPAGLLFSMALGFVDHSGLLHIDPWDYWFFHIPLYFVGLILARRRYK